MRSIAEIYSLEIQKELHRFGVWKPGDKIDLGDIILIEDGVMSRYDNIRLLGVEFEEEIESYDPGILEEFKTTNAISVETQSGANIPGSDKINIEFDIKFNKEQAIFYSAKGVKNIRIKNQLRVDQQIKKLNDQKQWDKKWRVVTHLTIVDSAIIIISKSANAFVKLSGQGKAGIQDIRVADLSLGLTFSKEIGIDFKRQFVSPTPLLFRAKNFKDITIFPSLKMQYAKKRRSRKVLNPNSNNRASLSNHLPKPRFVQMTAKDWK